MRRPRIATLGSRIAIADLRTARAPSKASDPHYQTAAHRAWRELVIGRANGRCEYIADGMGCNRAEPRMFADHIVELEDGGSPFDPFNGQCLCGKHHTIKTNTARARRHAPAAPGQGV